MSTPKKSLGQHWLFDRGSLETVLLAGELQPTDTVLEIGPGLGPLTRLLAQKAERVVAVETDREVIPQLKAELSKAGLGSRVEVVEDDILRFDLGRLPAGYKAVANIPYYLTSKIIRLLLESANPPALMALLIQKEVAERIVALPGQLSVLALSVQYYAEAKITGVVPKEKFEPPPKVDSAVIQIKRRPAPAFAADPKQLFRLVKAGFGEKRKQLKNALAGGLRISADETAGLLDRAGINASARAQELSLHDWERLYNEIYK